jgi:hypothetical protein
MADLAKHWDDVLLASLMLNSGGMSRMSVRRFGSSTSFR